MTSSTHMLDREQVSCSFAVPKFMKVAGTRGAAGAFAAFVLNVGNPLSGFVYCSTQSVMQQLLEPGVNELLTQENSVPSRVYLFVVTFLFSATVSISMTVAIGLSMSVPAALWLSATMIPASFVIDYLFKIYFQSSSDTG